MAGTWLDLALPYRTLLELLTVRSERKKDGGRHWARTSDLLHVKQVVGVQGGSLNVAGTTDTPADAASRLDFGWTYRLLEGMEE